MRRAFSPGTPELMDVTRAGSAALERDLDELENLNARFGGHEIVRQFLPPWLAPRATGPGGPVGKYRILDLATASGDIPRMVVDWARARGIAVEIDAVDFNPAALAVARGRGAAYPEINYIEADILRLEPGPASYDIVLCSQAAHHFGEDDAVRLLALCRHASRGGVLVADLTRRWAGLLAVWLLTATLYRGDMMKHDSRLSVRRAFTAPELRDLARRAGWENFQHRRYFPVRQAVWMHKAPASSASVS